VSEDLYEDDLDTQGSSGSRHPMAERFRGYLPVVVDVETGGFNSATDALLEIAAVTIGMDEKGFLFPEHTYFHRVAPTSRRLRWSSPGSSWTTRCAWQSARKVR